MDLLLLEKRGTLILRRLCALLDAERVYRELSTILEKEIDLDFARVMIEALNLILFNTSELEELRALLKQSLSNLESRDFFVDLYSSWCHSPVATIILCLLAQTYQHASSVLQLVVEKDIDMRFLFQLDKLVKLLEMSIFTHLRLQLLEPGQYPWLLKTLYGLLMLLPQQSAAFKILKKRLKTVPTYTFNGEELNLSALIQRHGAVLYVSTEMAEAFEFQLRNQQRNDHLQKPMAAKKRGGKVSQFSGIDQTKCQIGFSVTGRWQRFPIFQAVVGASNS